MKLTESEIEMFKALANTSLGKELASYYDRLKVHLRDCENWGPDDTKESAIKAASIIQTHLIDKIRLQNKPKDIEVNQFT